MAHHVAHDAHRVPPKPRDKGAAHNAVHHERRLKTGEGKAGVVGDGCTVINITYQTTASGGNPANYYPGIVTDATGLRAYNAGGVITMNVDAATGSVSVNGTGVITGGTIQTGLGNPRVVMDGAGINAYSASGSNVFKLDSSNGNLTVAGSGLITGATIQTASGSSSRVVMDTAGLRAYDATGNNTVSIDTTGTLTVARGSITLSSTIPAGVGARVTIDTLGIKGYDATNTQKFLLDATTGLIQATGVITAQPGSAVPWQTTNFFIGGGNLVGNASGEDPTTAFQNLYWNQGAAATSGAVAFQYGNTQPLVAIAGNPDFEGGTAGWSTTVPGWWLAPGATLTQVATAPHSGTKAGQVVTTAATINEGVSLSLGVLPAGTYIASIWVKGNVGGEALRFFGGIISPGTGDAATNFSATTSWTQRTVSFTSDGATASYIGVETTAAAAVTFFLDDALLYRAIAWNATASDVQSAIAGSNVLPIGATVSCTNGPLPGAAVTVILSNLGQTPTLLSAAISTLVGSAAIVEAQPVMWTQNAPSITGAVAFTSAFHGGNVLRITSTAGGTASVAQVVGLSGIGPGTTSYTLSAYFRTPSVARLPQLVLQWQDILGNTVSSATLNGTTPLSSTQWQRLVLTATAPVAATRQQVAIAGSPTSGSFKLVYNGQTTAVINWNATAAQVLTALQGLSNVGASGATGATGGPLPNVPVYVSFVSPPAAAPATMTFTANLLAGGTSPTPVITNSTVTGARILPSILGTAVGEQFYVDAVQLEVGDAPTAFSPRGDEILANVVQANMINVAQLSAISANLGTVTAGSLVAVTISGATINGTIITGGTVQTATTNPRVTMDPTGLFVTNSSGNKVILLEPVQGVRLSGGVGGYSAVSWHAGDVNGAMVGSIVAGETVTSQGGSVVLHFYDGVGGTNSSGFLQMSADANVSNNLMRFTAAYGLSVDIIDGQKKSAFLQLVDAVGSNSNFASAAKRSVVWFGAVGSGGLTRLNGIGDNGGGPQWSVVRTGNGSYTLTLNNGPPGVWPIVFVQTNEQSDITTRVDYVNTTTMNIGLWIASFNIPLDENWSFVAFACEN